MPTCETCRFFDTTGFEEGKEGYCHRNPPVPLVIKKGEITTTFARVPEHFWCGEHKEKH